MNFSHRCELMNEDVDGLKCRCSSDTIFIKANISPSTYPNQSPVTGHAGSFCSASSRNRVRRLGGDGNKWERLHFLLYVNMIVWTNSVRKASILLFLSSWHFKCLSSITKQLQVAASDTNSTWCCCHIKPIPRRRRAVPTSTAGCGSDGTTSG